MMLVTIALVAVYMHSSGTMRKLRNVDTMSQRAAREILQATIIQEKFINTGNGDLLISYESIRKDLRTAMADLQSSAVNGDLSKKVESMLAMVSHCDEIFGSMAQSLSRMHSHRKKNQLENRPGRNGSHFWLENRSSPQDRDCAKINS